MRLQPRLTRLEWVGALMCLAMPIAGDLTVLILG